jgi:hypothetical protein
MLKNNKKHIIDENTEKLAEDPYFRRIYKEHY